MGDGEVGFPLRPLLLTAGAVATAVGFYWRVKRSVGEETTASEGTPIQNTPLVSVETPPLPPKQVSFIKPLK